MIFEWLRRRREEQARREAMEARRREYERRAYGAPTAGVRLLPTAGEAYDRNRSAPAAITETSADWLLNPAHPASPINPLYSSPAAAPRHCGPGTTTHDSGGWSGGADSSSCSSGGDGGGGGGGGD